ncbi:hypothetical protein [Montanilutibacter psychrotolerans]|uniref:Transmembrane protein n=1 Tax=Montanilutibacter psychrotolerans TaxID=1327343 RepID=A0A3M8T4S3_9GAMM|nr:hypothetical protein [Lysobacter psychrotolerans]RNF86474.1 hypothetical protein EER27_03440 [Lysobacter psychrotolerans]
MEIPAYWAEARLQHRDARRQVTVRRFGWSEVSLAEAEAHAHERACDALATVVSGTDSLKREPKVPYNGAIGLPIREEVLERLDGCVITRNSYGAHCLNTPNVLIADIDAALPVPGIHYVISLLGLLIGAGATCAGLDAWSPRVIVALVLASLVFFAPLTGLLHRLWVALHGGANRMALQRVERFVEARPDWRVRLYDTPMGMRLIAMHRVFDPLEDAVTDCFTRLKVDRLYALMCRNQRCFRARLTGKPWRMGIASHMRPRPGVWPVAPERMPMRQAWVADYEAAAGGFAACRFLKDIGGAPVDAAVRAVVDVHDRESRVESTLPLA